MRTGRDRKESRSVPEFLRRIDLQAKSMHKPEDFAGTVRPFKL